MFPAEIYRRILYFCDGRTTLDALCIPVIYDSMDRVLLVQAYARRTIHKWYLSVRRLPVQYHRIYIRACIDGDSTLERESTRSCYGRAGTVIWKQLNIWFLWEQTFEPTTTLL